MIANEKQYRTTQKLLKEFTQHQELLRQEQDKSKQLLNQIHINALQAKIDDFSNEIAEYEALKSGNQNLAVAENIMDIGKVLIKARIANQWSQKQLAKELDIKEQQVQRYEQDEYQSASLPTLQRIAKVLGIKFLPIQAQLNEKRNNAA